MKGVEGFRFFVSGGENVVVYFGRGGLRGLFLFFFFGFFFFLPAGCDCGGGCLTDRVCVGTDVLATLLFELGSHPTDAAAVRCAA